jgi:hypothetical protein
MKGLGGDVPKEGHLAIITGVGQALGVKVGTMMLIVDDPKDVSKVIPVFLAEVKRDAITFRCACRKPNCTRVLSYKLRAAGHHPYDTVVTPEK